MCDRQDGRLGHRMAPQMPQVGGTGALLLDFIGEGAGVCYMNILVGPTDTIMCACVCVCACARAPFPLVFGWSKGGIAKKFSVVRPPFSWSF